MFVISHYRVCEQVWDYTGYRPRAWRGCWRSVWRRARRGRSPSRWPRTRRRRERRIRRGWPSCAPCSWPSTSRTSTGRAASSRAADSPTPSPRTPSPLDRPCRSAPSEHTNTRWCRKICGVGVSHVKPSNCFRRLEKLVLPSIFDTSLFHPWRRETCRVIQQVFNERVDILGGGSKHTLTPHTYFQGVRTPNASGSMPINMPMQTPTTYSVLVRAKDAGSNPGSWIFGQQSWANRSYTFIVQKVGGVVSAG